MTKATFTITGNDLKTTVFHSVKEFQEDDYAIHYEMEHGVIFMFDQYKRATSNFALNIIVDYNTTSPQETITIQCFALGAKNKGEIQLINYEKSTIEDFHAHLFGFSKRNKLNWKISELFFK